MSIVNAKLYEEEIRRKMWEVWYDEKYQYYFGDSRRGDFRIQDDSNGYANHAFAVLDADDNLIGVISYSMDVVTKIAKWFGAINFSDTTASKLAFSKALSQVITDCFIKFGCEVVEWQVIQGNPVEKGYDRVCTRVGGKIVSYYRTFINKLKEEIPFETLTESDLRVMGFGEWDNEKHLFLIPLLLWEYIPDGIEVVSIMGERYIKGKDNISDDTRDGYLAYCITPPVK